MKTESSKGIKGTIWERWFKWTPSVIRRLRATIRQRWLIWSGVSILLIAVTLWISRDDRIAFPILRTFHLIGSTNAEPTQCVVIDPGHGGADSGALGLGVSEKDLALDTAKRLEQILTKRGIQAVLTREKDQDRSLDARVQTANDCDLRKVIFVSIHFNQSKSETHGIETYYSEFRDLKFNRLDLLTSSDLYRWFQNLNHNKSIKISEKLNEINSPAAKNSLLLAEKMQTALITKTAAFDRGVKERPIYVIRKVNCPAVLIEGGYLSNSAEARKLLDPSYRQSLAQSMSQGMIEYLTAEKERPVLNAGL